MNSIWNKNIRLFTQRFPQLADLFKKEIELFNQFAGTSEEEQKLYPFWNVTVSKNGKATAKSKETGSSLHSAYNPEREAQNILLQSRRNSPLNLSETFSARTLVFEAFGIGYLPVTAAEMFPEKNFILLEPEPVRFFAALSLLDWSKVFSVSNLVIALSCLPEHAISLINQQGILDSVFFKISSQTAHQEKYFSYIDQLIERNLEKEKINNATLEKFGKLWIKNSLKNLKFSTLSGSILPYKNKGSSLPFTLIAAGPTLEYFLPYLQQIQKRSVTVCVDTALRACLSVNVEPDFIILTDPQYWAFRHIAGLKSPSSILITEASVVPAVYRFPCKKILSCQSNFMLQQIFEKFTGPKGQLVAGGSVASTAWNFCQFAGAKEIYTLGLDLSFPENKTHIKGSQFEQAIHTVSTKINSASTTSLPGLFSGNAIIESDYDNNKVLTDQRMKMFAWWFESHIEQFKDVKTFTFSTKGLKIPGIIPQDKEILLSKPEIPEKKSFTDLYLTEENSFTEEEFNNAVKKFVNQIKNVKSAAENLVLWFRETIRLAEEKQLLKTAAEQEQIFWIMEETQNLYELIKVLMPTPCQLNLALSQYAQNSCQLSDQTRLFLKKISQYSMLITNLDFILRQNF